MNYKVVSIVLLVMLIISLASFGAYYFLNRSLQNIPTIKEQIPAIIPTSTPVATESSENIIKDLTPSLNPDNNPNYIAVLDVREGNYARGTASFGGGGYGWYAVKQNGKWEVILKTQNEPPCATMQQYGFPQVVYKECF